MSKKIARWDLRETAKWVRGKTNISRIGQQIFLIAAGVVSARDAQMECPILNWSFAAFYGQDLCSCLSKFSKKPIRNNYPRSLKSSVLTSKPGC